MRETCSRWVLRVSAASLALMLCSIADAALIGHWGLDEASGLLAADWSGNDNHGTLTNMTGNEWTAGKFGRALQFDGLNDRVAVAPSSDFFYDSGVTFACWFKTDRLDVYQTLMAQDSDPQFMNLVLTDDALVRWETDGGQSFFSSSVFLADTWHHAAGTYDASSGWARLYLDGVLQMEGPLTSSVDFASFPFSIGALPGDWQYYQGLIDDVRVYDSALSAAEIADVMAGVGLVAVTIEATDATANENGQTGTLTISRTGATAGALVVNLATSGTAEAGDYVTSPDISGGSVTIADGQSSVVITLTPQQDADLADETVVVTIQAASAGEYYIGAPPGDEATVTIGDDDIPPPGTFALTYPIGGQDVAHDATTIFTWEEPVSSGPLTYDIQVSSDPGFASGMVVDETGLTTNSSTLPAYGMADADTYYWHVTAHNSGGSTAASNNNGTFDTPTDTTAPWVGSTSPSSGGGGADIGTTIRVVFSEPVTVPSLSTAVQVSGGVTGTVELSGTQAVVFTPDADLDYKTTYTVTVDSAITDTASSPVLLNGDKGALSGYQFTFTTFDELSGYGSGEGCVPGAGAGAACALLLLVVVASRRSSSP